MFFLDFMEYMCFNVLREEVAKVEHLNERINAIIKEKGITKTAFADRINISQAFVSQMCSGASQPSNRTIADICREFDVDEHWLRTGEGDMFVHLSRNEELADFFSDILTDENGFRTRLISALARLDTDQWKLLEQVADNLIKEMQKEKADQ